MSFASAKADARRKAPQKADFNRRERLRPTTGLRRLKERKMPTSRLSHRRAPRVHRFGPELVGRATLTGQRETSGQTGSGSLPDNSIIPGEDPTACGRFPRARPLPHLSHRKGWLRSESEKSWLPTPFGHPGLELAEGLKIGLGVRTCALYLEIHFNCYPIRCRESPLFRRCLD